MERISILSTECRDCMNYLFIGRVGKPGYLELKGLLRYDYHCEEVLAVALVKEVGEATVRAKAALKKS